MKSAEPQTIPLAKASTQIGTFMIVRYKLVPTFLRKVALSGCSIRFATELPPAGFSEVFA
jgi:hypothetical protein